MSLADDVLHALPELQAHAESLMTDYGAASRPTGGYAYNPASGNEEQVTTSLFESRCKIQARDVVASIQPIGDAAVARAVGLHVGVEQIEPDVPHARRPSARRQLVMARSGDPSRECITV